MTAEALVAAAKSWIGTPYRHRAALCGVGCDCLGLIRGIWRDVSGEDVGPIPPYRADWRDLSAVEALEHLAGTVLDVVDAAEPGDVLLFRIGRAAVPRHCGLLIAPDRFVHAQEQLGVVEAGLAGWGKRLAGVRRFRGVSSARPVSGPS